MKLRIKRKKRSKENVETLCSCLFDTIIAEKNDCMYQKWDKRKFVAKDLSYVKRLDYLDKQGCESYCRLSVLTNESMIIDEYDYFRVCRIIFDTHIFDLNKLRDLMSITVWSNGLNDTRISKYLIYWKGNFINSDTCPPSLSIINAFVDEFLYKDNNKHYKDVKYNEFKYNELKNVDWKNLESILVKKRTEKRRYE